MKLLNLKSKKAPKVFQRKILIRLNDRRIGTIEQFDLGYGFIKTTTNDEKYFIHHSDVLGTGFKKIEIGFEVEFLPSISDKGLQAKEIVLRDTRTAFQKFATFEDWASSINDLATIHAQQEDGNWDYINNKTGEFPVLESYITYTFLRLQKEGKIKYASKNEKGIELKFACINTGLATIKQEEIFAYFEHKDNFTNIRQNDGYLKQPSWIFKCFDRESNRLMNNFAQKPELANYFQNAAELIYDSAKRLIPDYEHIIDDREKRFPKEFRDLSKPQQVERVKSSIESALTRIRRNYKTAIPQYYSDSIQLLLPLCITTAENADVALVVANEGEVYRANTILPLDWAYNNARLLAKPDREWLNP
ncbi:cold shock CspA family protein [Flavobacterium sp. SORGH_AS 622]|nr:cold shock CspA family protein [Flavobacterium sp. SORGH_AS_0622]